MGLDEFTGIKLKGANFDKETALQLLFANKEPALGLLYGKNGAGKSTISKAFSKISGKQEDTIECAIAINGNGEEVSFTDEEKLRVHVFNEQYVDTNIKFRPTDKGLETIVVLGKANDIEQAMTEVQKAVNEQLPKVEKQQELCAMYENEKSDKSPRFYEKRMRNALKGEGAWAGRDAKIKEHSRATNTNNSTYIDFIKRKPTKNRDELIREFEETFKKLEQARSGIKKINESISMEKFQKLKFNEKKYLELLSKKIEKPELNEREQFLLSLQLRLGEEHPLKIKKHFENPQNVRCPYCLQIVDNQYKEELFESIRRVLSKEAQEHSEELSELHVEGIAFNYDPYQELDAEVLKDSKKCLEELNEIINEINSNIKRKKDDIYSPLNEITCTYDSALKKFIDSLIKLEETRVEYNKKATYTNPIKEALTEINSDIAYYDIIDMYKQYKKCVAEEKQAKAKLKSLQEELKKRNDVLQGYKEQIRDTKIALKQINKDLSYIFFSKNRLSIEMKENQYVLKSRGKSVSPSKISVGERNAIALCYFFSEIMREQKENDIYNNQYCLVIDDPVSSFDMENRVGILSFLKHQLNKFISGNKKTKVLVFTHDLQTAFDVEKIYGEITDLFNIDPRKRNKYIKTQELINNEVKEFASSRRNEYTQLLVNTYKYVKDVNPDYELVVGNSMRRVMEAYGSFVYKKGIEQLSTDPVIKSILPEPFTDHFENLMYRLVLHGGSHNEERVKSMISDDFFDYISSEEKKRTAKEILVFLYLLDNKHVLEHLKRDLDGQKMEGVDVDLDVWKNEIESLITVEE